MISTESIVEKLSDEELERAFYEIQEWRKTGVLIDGIVRETHNFLEMTNGLNIPIFTMSEPFLLEIARRNFEAHDKTYFNKVLDNIEKSVSYLQTHLDRDSDSISINELIDGLQGIRNIIDLSR